MNRLYPICAAIAFLLFAREARAQENRPVQILLGGPPVEGASNDILFNEAIVGHESRFSSRCRSF
jgi:hypothetical protein